MNRSTVKSLKALEEVLVNYGDKWEAWSASVDCPLTKRELAVIESYRFNKTHQALATELQKTIKDIRIIYHKGLNKLRSSRVLLSYQRWLLYDRLRDAGLITDKRGKMPDYTARISTIVMNVEDFCHLFNALLARTPSQITEYDFARLRIIEGLQFETGKNLSKESVLVEMRLVLPDSEMVT